jgi:hypothetical protein
VSQPRYMHESSRYSQACAAHVDAAAWAINKEEAGSLTHSSVQEDHKTYGGIARLVLKRSLMAHRTGMPGGETALHSLQFILCSCSIHTLQRCAGLSLVAYSLSPDITPSCITMSDPVCIGSWWLGNAQFLQCILPQAAS